jgi:hypothetical protein
MDELGATLARRGDERVRVEVRRDRNDRVGDARVQCVLVAGACNRDGAQTEAAARGEDADGDLAAVGDQQRPSLAHRPPRLSIPHGGWRSPRGLVRFRTR